MFLICLSPNSGWCFLTPVLKTLFHENTALVSLRLCFYELICFVAGIHICRNYARISGFLRRPTGFFLGTASLAISVLFQTRSFAHQTEFVRNLTVTVFNLVLIGFFCVVSKYLGEKVVPFPECCTPRATIVTAYT